LKKFFLVSTLLVLSSVALLYFAPFAQAMELDWGGEFRSEYNYIKNYTLDGSTQGTQVDPVRQAAGGYYITPAGNNDANFETLFLKLQPKLVVNDNIYIKSEFWLGDPIYGFYGGGTPYSMDQRYYNSTYSRGATITAQRMWADFLTDFGTVEVGRVPLQYGLGVNWNAGDGLWDHYESTGDAVRLIAKFGAFSFIPQAISYSAGNTVGGACQVNNGAAGSGTAAGSCSPLPGSGGLNDYSLQVKYENPDEDLEAGVNFIRRLAGGGQDPNSGYFGVGSNSVAPSAGPPVVNASVAPTPLTGSSAYNTYDIYAKKRAGKFNLGVEVPVASGNISGVPYSAWALAGEADWKINDPWELKLNFGHAPGQPNDSGSTPSSFKQYVFNPDYQIGLIMFNYQFHNFAGPSNQNNPNVSGANLASPYDNPISDANYLNATVLLHAEKWTFDGSFTFARATDSCSASQPYCWNNWMHEMVPQQGGDQDKALGWEMDYGAQFQYDEYFNFRLDAGLYFPGAFYSYANTSAAQIAAGAAASNSTSTVLALVGRVAVKF
jgi:hypothetical protein